MSRPKKPSEIIIKQSLIDTILSYKKKGNLRDADLARECMCAQSVIFRIQSDGIDCPSTIDKLIRFVTNLGYKVGVQIEQKHEPKN